MTAFYVKLITAMQGLRDRQEGQTLAEYALILALIAILLTGALTLVKGGISGALNTIAGAL